MALRSPMYTATHHATIKTFTTLSTRLKLHSLLLALFHVLLNSGFTL